MSMSQVLLKNCDQKIIQFNLYSLYGEKNFKVQ